MSDFNACHFETSAVRGASGGAEKTGAISFQYTKHLHLIIVDYMKALDMIIQDFKIPQEKN